MRPPNNPYNIICPHCRYDKFLLWENAIKGTGVLAIVFCLRCDTKLEIHKKEE